MEFRKIKGIKHYVFYTYEEMEAHFDMYNVDFPEIKLNWREASKGDWVLSDDGRIVQILRVGHARARPYKNWSTKYVGTVVGTFFCDDHVEMDTDFSKHNSRYALFGTNHSASKGISKANARKFYTVYKACCDPVRAYKSIFPKSDDILYVKRRAMATLLSDEVLSMIKDETKTAADRLKIDAYFVLKSLKSLIEGTKSDVVKLGSLKEVGKLIDVYPTEDGGHPRLPSPTGYYEDVTPVEVEEAENARKRIEEREDNDAI